ncbi:TrkH family potassium uptake protein [Desulfuromonas sp. TF]|uniref:TrkH family potassium uptake protein n=1 Tax=Desulfuromonas sp. TF TaxID=1232410 RepID=UPI0004285F65|nr:TrkH family potassium uptake protein [Desulfuromonas sp. TF]
MLAALKSRWKNPSPGESIMVYYAAAILLGALLLSTPLAARGEALSFLDALFTATSAQCVTGLIVVDTGTRLSLFGQMVVLGLIQIGGLGIMTFSVYFFLYLRAGVSLRGRWVLQETLMHKPVGSLPELIKGIFLMTIVIEGVGALFLSLAFIPDLGLAEGIYSGIFHSVSAFCNAGFSLYPDSLVAYRGNALVNVTVMALIILGGIGFLVIQEVLRVGIRRRRTERTRLSLHSRVVLLTSVFLILYGTVLIGWLEAGHAFAEMTVAEGFWTALFQSVTARTAGFNTIDLNAFQTPTLFLIMFLMFIGASPGSAGGGVKTTTFALFLGVLYSRLRGNPNTNLFRRSVPDEIVTRALTLVLLAVIFIGIALFGLLIAQSQVEFELSREFLNYAFETVSGFATVGLSLGATGNLAGAGKVIIIVLMFVGRVGLLTMAFSIAGRRKPYAARYAEENIMIG